MRGSFSFKNFTKVIPIGIILSLLIAKPLDARRRNNNAALIALVLLMSSGAYGGGHAVGGYGGGNPYGGAVGGNGNRPVDLGGDAGTTRPPVPTQPISQPLPPQPTSPTGAANAPAAGGESAQANSSADFNGICSADPYDAICRDQDARAASEAQQIQAKINELFLRSGVSFEALRQENANSAAAGTRAGLADTFPVGPNSKKFFAFIDGWIKETFPGLTDLFASTKDANLKGGQSSGQSDGNIRAVNASDFIASPDTNNPGKVNRYNAACGIASVNAFSAVDRQDPVGLNNVYICWPRLVAALVRSGGNPQHALADLTHTCRHEAGHKAAISGAFRACMVNRFAERSAVGERMAEWGADDFANEAIAADIRDGKTYGLSPRDYAVKAMQRLCGTNDTEDHPSARKRMKFFRENPRVASALGCGPVAGACTNRGAEGLSSFGRNGRNF